MCLKYPFSQIATIKPQLQCAKLINYALEVHALPQNLAPNIALHVHTRNVESNFVVGLDM